MESNKSIVLNYYKNTLKRVLLNKKNCVFFLIVFSTTIIMNYSVKNNFKNINSWDTCFYILENKYIHTFFYLGWFIIYLIQIYDENKIHIFIKIKSRSKINWVHSKLLSVFSLSIIYCVIYISCVFAICSIIMPYQNTWSIKAINSNTLLYYAHHYHMNISVWNVFFLLYVKYLLGLFFISILYLLMYILTKKNRIFYSTIATIIICIINIVWNMYILCPFFSVSIRSIFTYKESIGLMRFLLIDNNPIIISMCIFYIIIIVKLKKVEFME